MVPLPMYPSQECFISSEKGPGGNGRLLILAEIFGWWKAGTCACFMQVTPSKDNHPARRQGISCSCTAPHAPSTAADTACYFWHAARLRKKWRQRELSLHPLPMARVFCRVPRSFLFYLQVPGLRISFPCGDWHSAGCGYTPFVKTSSPCPSPQNPPVFHMLRKANRFSLRRPLP